METTEHDAPIGGFEVRLLAALSEADLDRPLGARAPGQGPEVPRGRGRRIVGPVLFGVLAVVVVAGVTVASGILGPATFQPSAEAAVAGDQLWMKGSGCVSGSTVNVSFEGHAIGTATADTVGNFQAEMSIPADAATGRHMLAATCPGPGGHPLDQHAWITLVTTRPTFAPTLDVAGAAAVGGSVELKGAGCAPGASVRLVIDRAHVLGTVSASEDGTFYGGFATPAGLAAGPHTLGSSCTGPAGATLDQTASLEVVPAEPAEPAK